MPAPNRWRRRSTEAGLTPAAGPPGPSADLLSSARRVLANRAIRPAQLAGYARMAAIRARYPSVHFQGPAFIGPNVRFEVRNGYGRIIVGAWCHFGEGVRVRCHEGTLRIGPKTVLAANVTVNTWLDIDIGAACLLGEGVYVCDFDHRLDDLSVPIKDQGIVKSPVHLADDVWLGTKSTVTRGTRMGRGAVLAANSVAKGDYPAFAVVAGSPARLVRWRDPVVDRRFRLATGRPERLREEVRAVILDGAGRVLLSRLDGSSADPPGSPWACPGGVPLPGESRNAALARFVLEQTGLVLRPIPDSAQPIWVERVITPLGRWDGRAERYYLGRVDPAPASGSGRPAPADPGQPASAFTGQPASAFTGQPASADPCPGPQWFTPGQLTTRIGTPGVLVTPAWLPERLRDQMS